jgi:Homeodomain-like domain
MKRLLTLPDEEREQIACRYKQEKNPRFRERLQCLLLKERGLTNGEVAEMLLVVPETITKWLNLYYYNDRFLRPISNEGYDGLFRDCHG